MFQACSDRLVTGGEKVDESVVFHLSTEADSQVKTWTDASQALPVLPVYWSDGDRINVNGVKSDALSVGEGERLASASFELRNVEAPFSILYPASAFSGIDERGVVSLEIPETQTWRKDSFGEGAALMYAYAEDEKETISLRHACGAISVNLSAEEGCTINSLSITSLGGNAIAGKFTLDSRSGELQAVEGKSRVEMLLPEGGITIVPSDGRRFIFTLPAGTYPEGFCLKFTDTAKHIFRAYWLRESEGADAGVTVVPGRMVRFEAVPYVPDAREITSAEDWAEFAAAYNAGSWEQDWLGKDGSVKIGADFTVGSLDSINKFADILDGQGHVITQTAATGPVFKSLSGTIRNLTLAGKMTEASSPGTLGVVVFASVLSDGGLISDCINRTEITVNVKDSKMLASAFVRTLNGGTLLRCRNEAPIKIVAELTNTMQAILSGAFAATAPVAASALIEDCTNEADITVTVVKQANSVYAPVQAGYGGIVGTVVGGTESTFLTLKGCVNNGKISAYYYPEGTGGAVPMSGVGGLVGAAVKYSSDGRYFYYYKRAAAEIETEDCVYMEMDSCINNGDCSNGLLSTVSSDDPYKAYCGGLAGILNGLSAKHIKVSSCANYGKVVGLEAVFARSALCVVTGGLCGFGGYVDFDSCTVVSKQIGSLKRQAYSASGGIGYAMMSFSLTNCSIFADIMHIRCTDYSDSNYSLAFTLSTKQNTKGGVWWPFIKIEGSKVSNCRFGGTFTLSKDIVTYNASTPTTFETLAMTASNIGNYIASGSFAADYYAKSFPDKVEITDNTYWNGL